VDVVEPAMVVSASSTSNRPVPRLRHRLEYALLRSAVAVARALPIGAVTAIGAGVVGFVGPLLRQNRRALANLEIAFPDKTPAERRRMARAMWANMGRTSAEMFILDRLLAQPERFEIVDRELWRQRMSTPGASIACTLHMGNWELAVWPLVLFGRTPAGVYKPFDNPLLDRWLAAQRHALYPAGLLAKGESEDDPRAGQRTARSLIMLTRGGGTIGFVADHFDRRGEAVAFMGRQSRFTTAPAMIARHVEARVWLGRCVRVGKKSRFRIELRALEVPRSDDKSGDAHALTTTMFAVFEDWIRQEPEQWMWWNTRWVMPDAAGPADPTTPFPG
jgi:Kdo2-lipid IVA lauroyltransferase/acyltransferase